MNSYIIRNNNSSTFYEFKTTNEKNQYMKVNQNNYLDLTTSTITGLNVRFRIGGGTYSRPIKTRVTTLTSSTSVSGRKTTGYSGVTSSYKTTATGYRSSSKYKTLYTYSGTVTKTGNTRGRKQDGATCSWWATTGAEYWDHSATFRGRWGVYTGSWTDTNNVHGVTGRWTFTQTATYYVTCTNLKSSSRRTTSTRYSASDYKPFYSDFTSYHTGLSLISGRITSTAIGNLYNTTALTSSSSSSSSKSWTEITEI